MHKVVYKTKLAALLLTGGMLSLVSGAAAADTHVERAPGDRQGVGGASPLR